MRELILSNGKIAQVDDQDFFHCLQYIPWHQAARGYVTAMQPKGKGKYIYLHVFIANRMGIEVGNGEIDHIDRNKLNCQRFNIRWASNAQNQMNRGVRNDSVTRIKGVGICRGKYQPYIILDGIKVHLGTVNTLEEATKIRREAELKHFGEFA